MDAAFATAGSERRWNKQERESVCVCQEKRKDIAISHNLLCPQLQQREMKEETEFEQKV